jgi:hypothetical protein
MEKVSIIGLDLAKRHLQTHGVRANGGVAFRRKLSRDKSSLFWPNARAASSLLSGSAHQPVGARPPKPHDRDRSKER